MNTSDYVMQDVAKQIRKELLTQNRPFTMGESCDIIEMILELHKRIMSLEKSSNH